MQKDALACNASLLKAWDIAVQIKSRNVVEESKVDVALGQFYVRSVFTLVQKQKMSPEYEKNGLV